MEEGWVYVAWAIENDGWKQFNSVKRGSRGYLGQEIDRLLALAKK